MGVGRWVLAHFFLSVFFWSFASILLILAWFLGVRYIYCCYSDAVFVVVCICQFWFLSSWMDFFSGTILKADLAVVVWNVSSHPLDLLETVPKLKQYLLCRAEFLAWRLRRLNWKMPKRPSIFSISACLQTLKCLVMHSGLMRSQLNTSPSLFCEFLSRCSAWRSCRVRPV